MFVWSVPWGKFWRNHFLICSDLCIKTVCHVMTIFLLKVRVLSGESNYIGDKNYHKIRLVKLLDPVGFAGDKTSCLWKLNNSPCHRLRNLSASNIFHKNSHLTFQFVMSPLSQNLCLWCIFRVDIKATTIWTLLAVFHLRFVTVKENHSVNLSS